jgi:hypothetical protein
MSTIGGATAVGLNVIASVVGTARPEAVSDQGKAASAQQTAQSDFDAALGESLDDVTDAQFSKDRDADGRQLYQRQRPTPVSDEMPVEDPAGSSTPVARSHATDAFGDRGNRLDIDA